MGFNPPEPTERHRIEWKGIRGVHYSSLNVFETPGQCHVALLVAPDGVGTDRAQALRDFASKLRMVAERAEQLAASDGPYFALSVES